MSEPSENTACKSVIIRRHFPWKTCKFGPLQTATAYAHHAMAYANTLLYPAKSQISRVVGRAAKIAYEHWIQQFSFSLDLE